MSAIFPPDSLTCHCSISPALEYSMIRMIFNSIIDICHKLCYTISEVMQMARPTKCRRVCHYPENLVFSPQSGENSKPVILTVDEFEVIRLIDREGFSQEDAGIQLGVGRTTVQKIYETARKKLADTLVLGLPLKIEGGDYRLCNGSDTTCPRHNCDKKQIMAKYQMDKGETIMRIAVTYENGGIFQHFGHTEQFKVYDIEDNKIVSSQVLDTNGSGHGALAAILQALNVDAVICGGIGGGAQMALEQAGIRLYGGVSGSADEAVDALLKGTLAFNPDVRCSHHDHAHGGAGHTCGEHGCGKGNCGNH